MYSIALIAPHLVVFATEIGNVHIGLCVLGCLVNALLLPDRQYILL